MHEVTHLRQRHEKVMENLERQQRHAEAQRRREEQRLDLALERVQETLVQGETLERSRFGFLRSLLPFF